MILSGVDFVQEVAVKFSFQYSVTLAWNSSDARCVLNPRSRALWSGSMEYLLLVIQKIHKSIR